MAVRRGVATASLHGTLGRWLQPADVEQMAADVAECATVADLLAWARADYTTVFYSRTLRAPLRDSPVGETERRDAMGLALVELARRRRWEAIKQVGGGEEMARCPTCGVSTTAYWQFYCPGHIYDQAADVESLLGEVLDA